jgi:hypothetical protein
MNKIVHTGPKKQQTAITDSQAIRFKTFNIFLK